MSRCLSKHGLGSRPQTLAQYSTVTVVLQHACMVNIALPHMYVANTQLPLGIDWSLPKT